MGFKSKQKVNPSYDIEPSIEKREINYAKEAEELFGKIIEMAFISSSPITGETIDVVRTSDICRSVCEYFGVDPNSTCFAHYQ